MVDGEVDLRGHIRTTAQVAPFVTLMVLLVGVPLVLLTTYSFRESSFFGVGSGPTLDQYRIVFENAATVRVMLRTIAVSLGVAAIVSPLAFTISYALTFRFRRRTALILLGVVVASGVASLLVRIFAWASILGTNGLINGTLQSIGLISSPIRFLFFGYFAIVVTMVYLSLPFAVLVVYSSMQRIDRHNVEASRDLGAGRWRTIFKVVAPQARIGILSAFALTAVVASADFVTPRLVGGARGLMIGSVVQDLALSAGNLPGAAALALGFLGLFVAVLAALLLIWFVARALLRPLGRFPDPSAAWVTRRLPARPSRHSLSIPLTGLLLLYLVLPTILVIVFSFNASPSTGLPFTGLTLHWYPEIVGRAGFADALRGSVIVTGLAVVGALGTAVPLAFALARVEGRLSRLLWALVFLPFVIPGVLLGSALIVASSVARVELGLGMTAAAHVTLLASEVVLIVYARLTGIDTHLFEASRDLGASPTRVLRSVTFPLLLPAIVGAALLATAYSLDEVFVTTFTIGSNNTLPIWLFSQARLGFSPGVNGVGVMLLFGTLLAFTLAVAAGKRTVLAAGSA